MSDEIYPRFADRPRREWIELNKDDMIRRSLVSLWRDNYFRCDGLDIDYNVMPVSGCGKQEQVAEATKRLEYMVITGKEYKEHANGDDK